MKIYLFLILLHVSVFAKIGSITSIRGDALLSRGTQVLSLSVGQSINIHDIITTPANAKIQITMLDNTFITIGSNSTYNFQHYTTDSTHLSSSSSIFRNLTKKINAIAPDKFKIATKTAVMGIREKEKSSAFIRDTTPLHVSVLWPPKELHTKIDTVLIQLSESMDISSLNEQNIYISTKSSPLKPISAILLYDESLKQIALTQLDLPTTDMHFIVHVKMLKDHAHNIMNTPLVYTFTHSKEKQ